MLDHPRAGRHRRARPSSSVTPWPAARSCSRRSPGRSATTPPTLSINTVEALAAVAQSGRPRAASARTATPGDPDACRAGSCSTSIPAPDVAFADVVAAAKALKRADRGSAASPPSARRPAARACTWSCRSSPQGQARSDWEEAKTVRPRRLRRDGTRARRKSYLTKMPRRRRGPGAFFSTICATTASLDRGGTVLSPRARRARAGVDAADLGAGEGRPRPRALHVAQRSGAPRTLQGVGRLFRCRPPAGGRNRRAETRLIDLCQKPYELCNQQLDACALA